MVMFVSFVEAYDSADAVVLSEAVSWMVSTEVVVVSVSFASFVQAAVAVSAIHANKK